MNGLDGLIGHGSGLGHAREPRDGFARIAGNARGFGEGSARAGFDDPEVDLVAAHDGQRVDDDAAIDADHGQHDAEQQAETDAGQHEAKQIVADVAPGEIHGAASARDPGRAPLAGILERRDRPARTFGQAAPQ